MISCIKKILKNPLFYLSILTLVGCNTTGSHKMYKRVVSSTTGSPLASYNYLDPVSHNVTAVVKPAGCNTTRDDKMYKRVVSSTTGSLVNYNYLDPVSHNVTAATVEEWALAAFTHASTALHAVNTLLSVPVNNKSVADVAAKFAAAAATLVAAAAVNLGEEGYTALLHNFPKHTSTAEFVTQFCDAIHDGVRFIATSFRSNRDHVLVIKSRTSQ